MGFLLIFCLQVLLFLFVSLVMEGGLSSKQNLNIFHLLGCILSIPVFVYGLASTLVRLSVCMHAHVLFTYMLSLVSKSSHFISSLYQPSLSVYISPPQTMCSEFVMDTWNGHVFFRSIVRWSAVAIDWYNFFAFLGMLILNLLVLLTPTSFSLPVLNFLVLLILNFLGFSR